MITAPDLVSAFTAGVMMMFFFWELGGERRPLWLAGSAVFFVWNMAEVVVAVFR